MKREDLIQGSVRGYKKLLCSFGAAKGVFNIFNQSFLEPNEISELKNVVELEGLEGVVDQMDILEVPSLFFIKIAEDMEPYISTLYSSLSQKLMRCHYCVFEINKDVTPSLIQKAQSYYHKISPSPRVFNPDPRILIAYADV